jgi:hypothetical protein
MTGVFVLQLNTPLRIHYSFNKKSKYIILIEFLIYCILITVLKYVVCYISGIDLSFKALDQNHFK